MTENKHNPEPKIIVSLSGGMDSATVLAWALNLVNMDKKRVRAIGFNYGSKHNVLENEQALNLCHFYGVSFNLHDISPIMKNFNSALMRNGGPIPEGHYEAENMRQTVVPNRNMIMTSILVGIAESEGFNGVALGVHGGDHFIYPDCRPAFIQSLRYAILEATDQKVMLYTPFLHDDKIKILQYGKEWGVPYEHTRTCYTSNEIACGKCGSCQERLTAFSINGIEDPIRYESRVLLPKQQ